jgi:hypothetical protein
MLREVKLPNPRKAEIRHGSSGVSIGRHWDNNTTQDVSGNGQIPIPVIKMGRNNSLLACSAIVLEVVAAGIGNGLFCSSKGLGAKCWG